MAIPCLYSKGENMIIFEGTEFYPIKNLDVEDYYYISKCGKVLSIFWNKPRILALRADKDGYLDVGLVKKNGKRSPVRVHRILALTFLDNPNNYPVVNHKNGIVDDNRIENLEWCTISHNTKHGYNVLGIICARQRMVKSTNLKTGEVKIFSSVNNAAEYYGLKSFASISHRVRGKYKNPSTSGPLKDIFFEYIGYTNVTTIENTTEVGSE